jgi:hypothetical protein
MTWRFHSKYYAHTIERLFDGCELPAYNLQIIKKLVKEASQ